jgi:hypothetical protein
MTMESAAFCTANVTSLHDEEWGELGVHGAKTNVTHDTYFNGMPHIVGPPS